MNSTLTLEVKADARKVLTSYGERRSDDSATPERKQRILFVDDEEEVRALGQALLEHLGYETVLATNGLEAIGIYQRKKIDLVVTDMRMPKMNGLELFRHIRKVDSNAKVILCSGDHMAREVDIALDAGAYGFLGKPFSINDLSAMVAHALEIGN